ncbi:MAG: cupin domain-containing protein, partial [Deltaproteobacteria bacterium]|nr:cupin domain-containing protein [Candidatus Zymogenaceae bacterium]
SAIDFDGLSIFDYTSNCTEKSSFAVINVPPDVSHRLSWSKRSDKFYYVMDGKIDFMVNGETYILNKGDLGIVKKGDKFRYKNDSNEPVLLILVHTPGFELDEEVFE